MRRESITDRMLELLRCPLTDHQWTQLVDELELSGSPLEKEALGEKAFIYTLPKLGVRLYADRNGWVLNMHFEVGPAYAGTLPFGLKPDFCTIDVHRLLGSPESANDSDKVESYFVGDFYVTVLYSLTDEKLEQIRLCRFRTSRGRDQGCP